MTTADARRSRTTTASSRAATKRRSSASSRTASSRTASSRTALSEGATALARAPQTTSAPRRSTKPKLEVLDQRAIRSRARRRNGLLAMFVVVLIGFFGVAFVHAELVTGQHELDVIRAEIAEMEAGKARTERAVEEASAPEAVVARAIEIGMVRATEPVYLAPSGPAPAVPTPVSFAPATDEEVDAGPVDETPEAPVVVIAAPAPTSDAELTPEAAPRSESDASPDSAVASQPESGDDVDVALPGPTPEPAIAAPATAPAPAQDSVEAPVQGIAGASVSTTSSGAAAAPPAPAVADSESGGSRTIAGSRAVTTGQGSG